MRSAVWHGRDDLRLESRPIEEPRDSECLVRVVACGLCATDLHTVDGSIPLYQPPRVLGHEVAGVVEAIGPRVQSIRVGDRVALDTSVPCDRCFYCREARPALCQARTPMFAGFADYVLTTERLAFRLPDDVSTEAGALAEPVSCVLHAAELAPIRAGSTAAVIGVGPIGLLMVQVLRRMGVVRLLVSDPDQARRETALALGATHAVNPLTDDLHEAASEATDGIGVDVAFEAVGAAATVEAAIGLPRLGGTVVLVGVAPGDSEVTIRPYELFRRELTIRASYIRSYEFERAVRLLSSLDLTPFVQLQVPLARIDEAFALARGRAAQKVLVCP
jgi:threonine dehydrogenase-like Zn-dependent dehydrogenase